MAFKPEYRTLLDAVDTAGTGAWVEVWPYEDISLHIYGIVTNDIIKIEGSNEGGDPANEVQIGADVTADGWVFLSEIPRKLRINLSADAGGGTISVLMCGRIPIGA